MTLLRTEPAVTPPHRAPHWATRWVFSPDFRNAVQGLRLIFFPLLALAAFCFGHAGFGSVSFARADSHSSGLLSEGDAVREIVQNAASGSTIRQGVKKADEKNRAVTVKALCIKIGAKLGSVSAESCRQRKLRLSGAVSVNGLPILMREYPALRSRKSQARVLLLGGIHGDEYSSISIVFKWMQILDRHHSGLFHWHIAPLVNPDGLLRPKAMRMNARGVDLNRNFPTLDWRRESRDYWIRRTKRDHRRYPGPYPLSEPESRWVAEEIDRFKPDVVVAVHAPFGLLDFDGPPTIPPEQLGHLFLAPMGTYPGSLGRYAGTRRKIPIITIELPYAGIMPSNQEIQIIWMDLVRWLRGHIFLKKPVFTPDTGKRP